jgi:hypothetical protein
MRNLRGSICMSPQARKMFPERCSAILFMAYPDRDLRISLSNTKTAYVDDVFGQDSIVAPNWNQGLERSFPSKASWVTLSGGAAFPYMRAETRLSCQLDWEPSLTCPCQAVWNVSYRSPFSRDESWLVVEANSLWSGNRGHRLSAMR